MIAEVKVSGYKVTFVSAYAPTEMASDHEKTKFYRSLTKAVRDKT